MGGIVAGAIGGAGKGMTDIGMLMLKQQLTEERDDANFMRDRELRREGYTHQSDMQDDQQSFASGESGKDRDFKSGESSKDRDFKAGENWEDRDFKASESDKEREHDSTEKQLDRDSAEKIASGKAKNAKPQLIKYTDGKGYEQEGVLRELTDGSYTIVKPDTGEVMVESITREELKSAAAQINVSEGRDSDWVPFNEIQPGDDRARVQAENNRGTKGEGIVASATKADNDETNGAPHPDGARLKGPDGKIYIVRNGKPELENP